VHFALFSPFRFCNCGISFPLIRKSHSKGSTARGEKKPLALRRSDKPELLKKTPKNINNSKSLFCRRRGRHCRTNGARKPHFLKTPERCREDSLECISVFFAQFHQNARRSGREKSWERKRILAGETRTADRLCGKTCPKRKL
jgi:hypothetical protein